MMIQANGGQPKQPQEDLRTKDSVTFNITKIVAQNPAFCGQQDDAARSFLTFHRELENRPEVQGALNTVAEFLLEQFPVNRKPVAA